MTAQNPIIAVYSRSGYPSTDVINSIQNYSGTNVNTLILSGPNGTDKGIVYNDPPFLMFNNDGQYVGDADWPASLAQLIAATNISAGSIYYSLGNSAISTLAGMSATALAQVMNWLKANNITGIDMDCENWGQVGGLSPMDPACQTVTLAAIQAGLTLTAAPYTDVPDWQSWCTFVSQKGGALAWLNVQCYDGGAYNDPVAGWATQFSPPVPIVAGFEASPGPDQGSLTPAQAQTQLQQWQAETPSNSLAGAFVWDYGLILSGTSTVSEFALAMNTGLTGHQNKIDITACDNELIVLAFQGNASYELARISSGYENTVNVTINIAAGNNNGPAVYNGVTSAINETITLCLPSFDYSVAFVGINWSGPTQFAASVNGTSNSLPAGDRDPGIVWTPNLIPITV